MSENKNRPETTLVAGGRRKEWRRKLVNVPVERASTILFDSVADMKRSKAALGVYSYGLQGTATHWALAEALTELEPGAAGTALFSSGLGAITTSLLAVVKPGDEVLVPDHIYGPTRRFCDDFLKRYGVATRYYDPLVGSDIAGLISSDTRAIMLESPGSLTMEVQDVPAICAVARDRGIPTLIDNTWATPLFFPALAAGVDITILAATKYVGGHADVMLGAVSATAKYFEPIQRLGWDLGHSVSADDAWLGSRGLRTMAVRLKQHQDSALRIAQWLKSRPEVGLVLHPALADCPGHEFWQRDFTGASGLFSFELKGADADARAAFVERLKLFGIGYSWGGYESLAIVADPVRTVTKSPAPSLIRIHVGLENCDDLIADLTQALQQLRN